MDRLCRNGESAVEEIEALLALTHVPGIGPKRARVLIEAAGSVTAALNLSEKSLQELPGFGPSLARSLVEVRKARGWEEDMRCAAARDVELIPFWDKRYPERLLKVEDPPSLLYAQGAISCCEQLPFAIVGTRNCSLYGQEMAEKLSSDLSDLGFTIISGLARGIDTFAHRAALKAGQTAAVIGSGLASIYPRENESLASEIRKRGALISELPMRTPPEPKNFPRRNRIVAGLSIGILLIEAPINSGAMITMRLCQGLGLPLFAIPGRIDGGSFEGNHQLIKEGSAKLVESGREIAAHFGISGRASPKAQVTELTAEERDLLKRMKSEELSIDEISLMSGMNVRAVNVLLMGLVLKKVVKEHPGKLYKKSVTIHG